MNFFKKFLNLFSSHQSSEETVDEEIKRFLTQDMIRARDNKGRYVPDDPDTEENEAYVVRKKN
tara:strand:- start:197 stop:385 length:189 start_codon:yes stop_codon:yes gene_type:complete